MDLGTWADWANVVGAGVVGGAVIVLTRRTNKLAEAANRTSETVAELESKRDETEAASREDERRLILISLSYPVGSTKNHLRAVQVILADSAIAASIRLPSTLDLIREHLELARLTIAESVRARLHCVDLLTAARILRTEAAIPTFLAALNGLALDDAGLREFGLRTMKGAIENAISDADAVWRACHEACRQAGLSVGALPPYLIKDEADH